MNTLNQMNIIQQAIRNFANWTLPFIHNESIHGNLKVVLSDFENSPAQKLSHFLFSVRFMSPSLPKWVLDEAEKLGKFVADELNLFPNHSPRSVCLPQRGIMNHAWDPSHEDALRALDVVTSYLRKHPEETGHFMQKFHGPTNGLMVATARGWVPVTQLRPEDGVMTASVTPMQQPMNAPGQVSQPTAGTIIHPHPHPENKVAIEPTSVSDWSKVDIPPVRGNGKPIDKIVIDNAWSRVHATNPPVHNHGLNADATAVVSFLNDCLARVNKNKEVPIDAYTSADLWYIITGICQNGLTSKWAEYAHKSLSISYLTYNTVVVGKDLSAYESVLKVLRGYFDPMATDSEPQSEAEDRKTILSFEDFRELLTLLTDCLTMITSSGRKFADIYSLYFRVSQSAKGGMLKEEVPETLRVLGEFKGDDGKFFFAELDDKYKEVAVILSKYID